MSKPVLIAQISDLHIKPTGQLAYGRVDTVRALERCIATLNEFRPAPDFVVISGDLADTPVAEEYDDLARVLATLNLPFAAIPGNHDSRELMRAAFPRAAYAFASGALNQKIGIGAPPGRELLHAAIGDLGDIQISFLIDAGAVHVEQPAGPVA